MNEKKIPTTTVDTDSKKKRERVTKKKKLNWKEKKFKQPRSKEKLPRSAHIKNDQNMKKHYRHKQIKGKYIC